MYHEYFVIKIETNDDIIVVYANPIVVNPNGYKMVSENLGVQTESFIFPNILSFHTKLSEILYSQKPWTPNMLDYTHNEGSGMPTKLCHIHVSAFGQTNYDDLNMGHETIAVPAANYKFRRLSQDFVHQGWSNIMTLREYIDSLATGTDVQNFWGWLFDNPGLNDYSWRTIPLKYKEAYQAWLDKFL